MSSVALIPNSESRVTVDYNKELEGAKMLLKSGLLPNSVKSPEAALFIILAGRDLGLSPVQSLRSINIIQGKVEVAADMQLGLFHRAGGKSRWVKLTNEIAILQLSAPWLIEPHSEMFGLDDAKRAKLAGDNWAKYPKAMLRSRAITAGLKSVGFDPTAGVYDYGEIGGPEPSRDDALPYAEPTTEGAELAFRDESLGKAAAEEPEQTEEEKAAMVELEDFLAANNSPLTVEQQEYVRTQLSDGADPVSLRNAVKIKLQNKIRAKA